MSKLPDHLGFLFREDEPGGLSYSVGAHFGGKFYPNPPKNQSAELRADLVEHRSVVTPSYAELWTEPMPDIPSVVRLLKKDNWLSILSRVALAMTSPGISYRDAERAVLSMLTTERKAALVKWHKDAGPRKRFIDPFAVLASIQIAAIYAEPGQIKGKLTDEQGEAIPKLLYMVSASINEESNSRMDTDLPGVVAALTERSSLGHMIDIATRAVALWTWPIPNQRGRVTSFRAKADAIFKKKYGVSILEWQAVLAHAIESLVVNINMDKMHDGIPSMSTRYDNSSRARNILNSVSGTWEEFKSRCEAQHAKADLWKSPTLVPLATTPLISISPTESIVLSPVNLALAMLEFPLRAAKEEGLDLGPFGDIVEDYCHHLLSLQYGRSYTPLAPLKDGERADGIIWFSDGFVVVESKSNRTNTKYVNRNNARFLQELGNRDIPKAVGQINATIDDVLSGAIEKPWWIGNPSRAGSLILVADELPLTPLAAPALNQVLPPTKREPSGVLRLQPQIMEIDELERLDSWDGDTLIHVLGKKMLHSGTALEAYTSYQSFMKCKRKGTPTAYVKLKKQIAELMEAKYKSMSSH